MKITAFIVMALFIGIASITYVLAQEDEYSLSFDTIQYQDPEVLTKEHIVIALEIKSTIKNQYPLTYEKKLNQYKEMLTAYNVQYVFKDEIEHLLMNGYKLGDILTAYEYLYDQFGIIESLEAFVIAKAGGQSWIKIFEDYTKEKGVFQPSIIDSVLLEDLMEHTSITPDDIMLADRLTFSKAELSLEEVFQHRLNGLTFKEINAHLGIINSSETLPRVEVTPEKIKQYKAETRLTENQIIEAMVLAYKLIEDESSIVTKMNQGLSQEAVYAEYLEAKYME